MSKRTNKEPSNDNTPKGKISKKKIGIISAVNVVAVIVIAAAIGLCIYNTPEKRIERQLALGNKYLEEENYEQAVLAFEEAIAVDDRCMEAYVGGIEAYLKIGDTEGLMNMYEKSLGVIAGLDEAFVAENIDAIVEIYLFAKDVYVGNKDKIIGILEEGLLITNNEDIKNALIKNYIELANRYTDEDNYIEATVCFDKLLEISIDDENIITELEKVLEKYIGILIEEKNYDKVRELAKKYGDIVKKLDFKTIIAQIIELERIEAENIAFLDEVYGLMSSEDYMPMLTKEFHGKISTFKSRMKGNSYIYLPDDSIGKNRMGVGVYRYGEYGCYLFYGNFIDGKRVGDGVSFESLDSNVPVYSLFKGEWNADAPNGYGEYQYQHTANNIKRVQKGFLVDGLWEGEVEYFETDGSQMFDLSYVAKNGIPKNKTEEAKMIVNDLEIDEDKEFVYAYDVVHEDGATYITYPYIEFGKTKGIMGFADETN